MCDISLLKLGKVEKLLFNRYRVFVGNDEKVLSKESGDGYTTLWMYLMPVNYTIANA